MLLRYFVRSPHGSPYLKVGSKLATFAMLVASALPTALVTPLAPAAAQSSQPDSTEASTTPPQQPSDSFSKLSAQEQTALIEGKVTLSAERSGDSGQFTARILVKASATEAWAVLTDYDNFEKFLPNIENSQLLKSEENRRVFEQLNVVELVPEVVDIRSRVVIESTESYLQRVDFSLVEGDLEALSGFWKLDSVAIAPNTQPDHMLITHQVDIDPGDSSPRSLFFSTYRIVLEDSLLAAKAEAERRAVQ